jgi:hypothetical protein
MYIYIYTLYDYTVDVNIHPTMQNQKVSNPPDPIGSALSWCLERCALMVVTREIKFKIPIAGLGYGM